MKKGEMYAYATQLRRISRHSEDLRTDTGGASAVASWLIGILLLCA
jgi:hypothetical protein